MSATLRIPFAMGSRGTAMSVSATGFPSPLWAFEGCIVEVLRELGLMEVGDSTPTPNPSPQGGGGSAGGLRRRERP